MRQGKWPQQAQEEVEGVVARGGLEERPWGPHGNDQGSKQGQCHQEAEAQAGGRAGVGYPGPWLRAGY